MSVLCPGFVQTRIGESNRNAPASVAEWTGTPDAEATAEFAKALTDAGIEPEVVADAVRDAIVDDTFFIVPHERAAVATTRARRRVDGRGGVRRRSIPRARCSPERWRRHGVRGGTRHAWTGGRRSAHGRAASSCAATRNKQVFASGCGRRAGRRSATSRSAQCSGTDIAGWPVTLNGTVNAAYGVAAKIAPSASSPRISPSGAGGLAMVGVRSRSKATPSVGRSHHSRHAPRPRAERFDRVEVGVGGDGAPELRPAPR